VGVSGCAFDSLCKKLTGIMYTTSWTMHHIMCPMLYDSVFQHFSNKCPTNVHASTSDCLPLRTTLQSRAHIHLTHTGTWHITIKFADNNKHGVHAQARNLKKTAYTRSITRTLWIDVNRTIPVLRTTTSNLDLGCVFCLLLLSDSWLPRAIILHLVGRLADERHTPLER
jgi:hypothetical protein